MISEPTNERNTVFVRVNTDKFGILYNIGNLFKAQFIFFIGYKIFSMTFCMFDTVFPEEDISIRRKNIFKFRIFFNN